MPISPEVLHWLKESDPTEHLAIALTANTVKTYAPIPGFYAQALILDYLPCDRLQGLRLILSVTSPIAVDPRITGWYHKLFQVAWVSLGRPDLEVHRSILHESGHHLWSGLSRAEQQTFTYRTRRCRGGANDWNIPEERFADAIALAVLGADTRHEQSVADCAVDLL
jgi:hypothetical protein